MNLAEYIPFYKRNLRLALPVVMSQIGQVTVQLVDIMMVGHVGTAELAAAAYANNIFMIGMLFGMGITYGITPMVGNAFGNKDLNKVVVLLKNGVYTHFAVALVLTAIMATLYLLLPLLGQPPEVVQLAKPYYLLLCLSYLPFMLFFSFKQFFEGIGNTKMAMQITLISNVINVIVNYLFIFGKFGFPELGLNGAGIGTLVSRLFMPLLFLVYISRISRFRKYFSSAWAQSFHVKYVISILRIGIPIGFQIIVEVFTFALGAIMMGWFGETPLAAHQVALGLASFTYMISLGVSQANTIRVSHQMGVKDYKSLKMAAFASTHLVLAFMMIMGIVFIMARYKLPVLFTSDGQVVIVAAQLLIVAAFFQVFDGLQVVMLSTLRGMADVKVPMIMAFIAYLVIGIPTSYVFAFILHNGPQGIWFGYLVGLASAGVMFYYRFKQNLQKKA